VLHFNELPVQKMETPVNIIPLTTVIILLTPENLT